AAHGHPGHRPGRARHGHRVRLLRSHRRAPPGARAGRRDARRDPRRRRCRGHRRRTPPLAMLALRDVDVYIQASHILRKVSLEAAPGELVCLVGRNGAGKTTTLRAVMGYLRPAGGTITLAGQPIGGLPTHAIARLGPASVLAVSILRLVPVYASRLYVIERGEIVFAGLPQDLRGRPDLARIVGQAL